MNINYTKGYNKRYINLYSNALSMKLTSRELKLLEVFEKSIKEGWPLFPLGKSR